MTHDMLDKGKKEKGKRKKKRKGKDSMKKRLHGREEKIRKQEDGSVAGGGGICIFNYEYGKPW